MNGEAIDMEARRARWALLEALFDAGVQLTPAQRADWLAGLDVDDDVRTELAAMLAADDGGQTLRARVGAAVAGAVQAPAMGERIGAWRLVRELGSGGMGAVFLVERVDGGFSQQAALKLIRGVATRHSIRQLRHERQVLAALEHPGIARLLDGGETAQGQPYLVVEYVDGEPITIAAQRRALPLAERLRLVREVALAVHHAHRQLVIHRDIKPANVLLRDDGRPVLLDFGIAKLLDADAATATATFFTPAYASPEQRAGSAVTTATDVYALGLLLCELLTDQPPAIAGDGSVRAPSERVAAARRRALRGDLDRIVARACAVEPERRYESAAALANDIDRHLAGVPIRAAPDSPAYVLGKFARRHPFGLALGALAVLLLALSAWRVVDERDRALAAERIAEQQSGASQAVTGYLIGLFDEADPQHAARSLTPTELIDRGVARLAADEAIGADARARLLGALGAIYFRLGLPSKGSQTLRNAVAHARSSGDRLTLADTLYHLGGALDERGQFDEAELVMREALALFQAGGFEARAAQAQASLALVHARLDRLADAERGFEQAIRALVRTHGPEAEETLRAIAFRTELWRNTGRADQARAELERILPLMESRLGPDHPSVMELLGYYGNTLLALDDTTAAQAVFERMLARREHVLEGDRTPLAFVHNGLGMLYYQQGRTRDAAEQMQRALAISERTLGADDPSLALDLNNVGALFEELGDYARAEPLMRRALAIMDANPVSRASMLGAQYRQNLGRLLLLAGQADEALVLLSAPIADEAGDGWATQRARQALHLGEWHRRYGDAARAASHLADAGERFEAMFGADSARVGAVLRSRGLLAFAAGRPDTAASDLAGARERIAAARGEGYLGVAEIDLDLAEIALARGDQADAVARITRAAPVIDAVAAEAAPQRQRLRALQQRE
jgi:eukaryotic-like serine/threonine-protein kinase